MSSKRIMDWRPKLLLARWIGSESGNFALVAAVLAPVLFALAGGAIDLYVYDAQQKQLQNVADSAVLAAAREASLEGWSQATAEAVTASFIDANLGSIGAQGSVVYSSAVSVDEANRRVSVTIEQDHYGYFVAGYFKRSPQISVTAVAQGSGSANICVIGLEEAGSATVSLDSQSLLSAPDCAIYSNSSDTKGMASLGNSRMTASLACSAGGYEGAPKNYNKLPLTDCPFVADPLATRPPPHVPPCLGLNLGVKNLIQVLLPGVYCGGLKIDGNSKAILTPGIYVIKDGPFIVDNNATVDGLGGVGIYLTGKNARFEFKSKARVDLEAPSSGPMAGLLFFQDRASAEQDFKITSDYTRNLIGTIYLPNGNLIVDAHNDVADQSAYTAIVVKRLQLRAGPNLVLNTDYDKTTVPTPSGVGPSSGEWRLVE